MKVNIAEHVEAILLKYARAVGEVDPNALVRDIGLLVMASTEMALIESAKQEFDSAQAKRLEAVRKFYCGHWKITHQASHSDPAPCDSWDKCDLCGAILNFQAARCE